MGRRGSGVKHQSGAGDITSRHIIRSLKADADAKRSLAEKFADWMSGFVGGMGFLIANVVLFAVWIILNVNIIPGVQPFDPFPFGFLTMAVSLEAIILSIFVLIAQNRAAKVDELRAETDLQIDLISEEELTKLLQMVSLLLEKHGFDPANDADLQAMISPTNVEKLKHVLEKQTVNESS